MLPIRKTWYLQLGRENILSLWRAIQYSLLTIVFSYVFAEIKRLFFEKKMYKSWELLVTLQLPSDCCVVFWTNESENKILLLFVHTHQKRQEVPFMEKSRDNDQKRKESHYMEKSRDNDQKDAYKSNEMQLQNHSITFLHKNKSLFQPPPFYLVHPCLTTLLLPWTS